MSAEAASQAPEPCCRAAQGDLPKRSPSALYTFPLGFTFLFLFKLGFEPVQKTQFYTS